MNRPISAVGGALTRNDKWGSVPGKPEVDEGGISLKKAACILFVIFLLVGCNAVDAEPHSSTTAMSKADAMMEISQIYLETELKLTNAVCTLGNRLSVFRLNGGNLITGAYEKYPVYAEGKVVAFTSCFLSETGEYLTNCGAEFAEAFWRAYSEQPDVPVAIVYAQDGAYLVREGENPILLHKMPVADADPIEALENCRADLMYSVP